MARREDGRGGGESEGFGRLRFAKIGSLIGHNSRINME